MIYFSIRDARLKITWNAKPNTSKNVSRDCGGFERQTPRVFRAHTHQIIDGRTQTQPNQWQFMSTSSPIVFISMRWVAAALYSVCALALATTRVLQLYQHRDKTSPQAHTHRKTHTVWRSAPATYRVNICIIWMSICTETCKHHAHTVKPTEGGT